MTTKKFWPLDLDPEVEIYENLSWDLPGYRNSHRTGEKPGRFPRTRSTR